MDVVAHQDQRSARAGGAQHRDEGRHVALDRLDLEHRDARLHIGVERERQKVAQVGVGLAPIVAQEVAQAALQRIRDLRFVGPGRDADQ